MYVLCRKLDLLCLTCFICEFDKFIKPVQKRLAFIKNGNLLDSILYKVSYEDLFWKIYSNYARLVISVENIDQPKIFYEECSIYTSNAWIPCGRDFIFIAKVKFKAL